MAPASNPGTTVEDPSFTPAPLPPMSPSAKSTQNLKSPAGPSTSNAQAQGQSSTAGAGPKRRKHRGGKKKRNRRQSFAARSEATDGSEMANERPSLLDAPSTQAAPRTAFYRLGQNHSNTSLDSDVLMDHRDHGDLQARRQSIQQGLLNSRPSQIQQRSNHRSSFRNPFSRSDHNLARPPRSRENVAPASDGEDADDRTPLLSSSAKSKPTIQRSNSGNAPPSGNAFSRYGVFNGTTNGSRHASRPRRLSTASPARSGRRNIWGDQPSGVTFGHESSYDVNNPPSRPSTPPGGSMGYNDVMLTSELTHEISPNGLEPTRTDGQDTVIDIDPDSRKTIAGEDTTTVGALADQRRHTLANPAEADVCFPTDELSEIGEEDFRRRREESPKHHRRRRRYWPDLSVLEDWATEEKEERSQDGVAAKRLREDVMIGGRLRPKKTAWHRDHSDAPFRWTYFNEEFDSTIHSQTISGLVQPGQSFQTLFVPDPPELDESSSEDEEDGLHHQDPRLRTPFDNRSIASTRQTSIFGDHKADKHSSGEATAQATPSRRSPTPRERPKRFGARPIFWLDVLSPTEAEMRILSKAFGIHPLTVEDILMQEPREKVELFKNYYFVNYRTFEQDENSEDFMEALNMYAVVFREGVISFHFSMTPHPANVRRRIRQLSDYLILSSDWISYAIIDDITDVYAPLIQRIEDEVDQIDDEILQLHSTQENSDEKSRTKNKNKESEFEKMSEICDQTYGETGGHMLRRVGECRKKVMSLYRLLGNKADVIKGFAKRCNEQWDVAPRSEIGLYLGDIQDHIITMTGNLSHYENLLSRAHSNYLAQINMRMNERQEQTADVLGKLTVLGTIVLPMNIITGMWGMNVLVPGQDVENLNWFFAITAGLIIFGVSSYMIAKRVYGIV
ncbi:cora-domain-containing protein [Viridothelium virens]|uniref:Cora-domain-containing protein n=1 Tax=Viridothelium virens TaxID=1048519 RepID=A0A6A6H3B2_VIRVR|nr:cora-domain-containing protein [Viridothelium virens]